MTDPRRISWLAVNGPGVSRMCSWTGPTRLVYVSGITREWVSRAPMSVELPAEAVVHDEPPTCEHYTFVVFLRHDTTTA